MSDYRLVYYSANRLSGSPADLKAQIDAVLAVSRRNNSLVDVTGALMFTAQYFGQVLEGPRLALEATFERIQQDARHGEIAMLEFAPVPVRSFNNWSMAFVGPSSKITARFDDIGRLTGFDPSKLNAEELFQKMAWFIKSTSMQTA